MPAPAAREGRLGPMNRRRSVAPLILILLVGAIFYLFATAPATTAQSGAAPAATAAEVQPNPSGSVAGQNPAAAIG